MKCIQLNWNKMELLAYIYAKRMIFSNKYLKGSVNNVFKSKVCWRNFIYCDISIYSSNNWLFVMPDRMWPFCQNTQFLPKCYMNCCKGYASIIIISQYFSVLIQLNFLCSICLTSNLLFYMFCLFGINWKITWTSFEFSWISNLSFLLIFTLRKKKKEFTQASLKCPNPWSRNEVFE